MKYIRTKDGIIESKRVKFLDNGQVELTDGKHSWRLDYFPVINQADTIEELCDGFWWENTRYKEPIFIPNYGLVLDKVKAWKESDKELNENSFDRITIYGSVYIRGYGWKHVCKVNKNKEELELL